MKRTKVLFVGGYGRSGSTIIDIVLNRVPGVVAVGEFRHLFGRALGDNELCSCGQKFSDCPYWGEVLRVAFPKGVDREQIQKAVKAVNRLVVVPRLLWPALTGPTMRRHMRVYNEAFAAAYAAVAKVSGASVVVDSTKYPVHGLFLRTMPELDLSAMMLVRDPRAVAYSWTKHRLRPEIHWEEREMPRHHVVRSAIAWNLSNSLTKVLEKSVPFRVQRYEDFVASPQSELQDIASFALGKQVVVKDTVFKTQKQLAHTIAGNPVRIGHEQVKVKADTGWMQEMSELHQFFVTAVCWPQMRRYGYPLRNQKSSND